MVRKINIDRMWNRMLQHFTKLLPLHICIGCWSIVSNISPCRSHISSPSTTDLQKETYYSLPSSLSIVPENNFPGAHPNMLGCPL
jgi:hypothetical protein